MGSTFQSNVVSIIIDAELLVKDRIKKQTQTKVISI